MPDEQIIARRITLDEYLNYTHKLEYIDGRLVTGPGIELFVGVKEFAESIEALAAKRKQQD
jgi:hypothetical protein